MLLPVYLNSLVQGAIGLEKCKFLSKIGWKSVNFHRKSVGKV